MCYLSLEWKSKQHDDDGHLYMYFFPFTIKGLYRSDYR